ncbi:MAG: hypothetical protein WBA46_10630, partial [Thermomicrobiales bacterium]
MTIHHPHDAFAVRGRLLAGTYLDRGTVVVENGRIASVHRTELSNGDLPPTVIDADIISPGMIDLQVNGAIGREVSPNPGDIEAISRWMPISGVTAWLPTVVTADASFYPQVFASWDAIDRTVGAIPLGYHLEGPFLSPERKGAHQLQYIEAASDALFDSWLDEPSIALVTVAPEREGGLDRIRALVEQGILTSVGHTNATYEQLRA